MDLAIIIVNWNTKRALCECLNSINSDQINVQVLVVDNASVDGSQEMVRTEFPHAQLLCSEENLGFGRANNWALDFVKAPYVLFLNPDTIVKQGTLDEMVEFMQTNLEVGGVGCKITDGNGDAQPLGLQTFPTPFTEFFKFLFISEKTISKFAKTEFYHDPDKSGVINKYPGCSLMVRTAVLNEIGKFDDRFFMYCEDVDLCKRINQSGWKLYYLSKAEVAHLGGEASSRRKNHFSTITMCESIAKLMAKYYGRRGEVQYRLAVFFGSQVRLLLLVLLQLKSILCFEQHKKTFSESFQKYFVMIKWSLNRNATIAGELSQ